ncbi:MAG: CGNR zinc finger domain-containing protein [Thermoleophilaceae bacterium]
MLRVTWEWLGQDPALDVANTVAVVEGDERDLIAGGSEYERWAAAEASALGFDGDEAAALVAARSRLLGLRPAVRAVIAAAASGRELPEAAVAGLNRTTRSAPAWVELDPATGRLRRGSRGDAADRVVAAYAQAAMELVAGDAAEEIRVCPAPSCGMFYRPGRSDQHWCSPQCGSRARVARHYRVHKSERRSAVR